MAAKRIMKELRDLEKEPLDCGYIKLVDPSEMFVLEAKVEGPAGTPYEGGIFKF